MRFSIKQLLMLTLQVAVILALWNYAMSSWLMWFMIRLAMWMALYNEDQRYRRMWVHYAKVKAARKRKRPRRRSRDAG
jgi:hypothetical protein